MQFSNLDIGFDGAFDLMMKVENSRSVNNSTTGFKIEGGVGNWSGADVNNSQSNATTFENVRDFALNGATSSFMILDSDGVTITNCISEGGNPTSEIYFDDQNSTTIKTFEVDNFHSENSPTDAIIVMRGRGTGTYTFKRIFTQTASTLLDNNGQGVSIYNITNIPWVNSFSTAFKISSGTGGIYGTTWNFENWGDGSEDISNGSWWSTGVAPYGLYDRDGSVLRTQPTEMVYFEGGLAFATDNTFKIGRRFTSLSRPYSIDVGTGGSTFAGEISVGTTSTPWGKFSIIGSGTDATPDFVFADSNNSPKFVIQDNGLVGIATTSPDMLLTVGSNLPSGSIAHFENSTGSCYINPTTTSLSCSSDARLKANVVPLDSADGLAAVLQLHPVTYNWKSESATTSPHTGFIAQDVQPVLPDLVSQGPDGYYTLNYAGLTPYLVKAIQEIATISGTFKTNLIAWLGSATKTASPISYASIVHSKETDTQKLCVTDSPTDSSPLCLTKSQLAGLLSQAAASNLPRSVTSSSTPQASNSGNTGNANSTPPVDLDQRRQPRDDSHRHHLRRPRCHDHCARRPT